ncbi:hypothetical protein KGM_213781 [Danaus plexippus plexippus]|uniref:Uncharacterized protein n=1 Tax=Danaus plexippus plexippus TaxID=278856 RepID=A0A212FE25_DANPL|nr:hypothetical protein KGM_213781 [Danaus plexippus plexippus]
MRVMCPEAQHNHSLPESHRPPPAQSSNLLTHYHCQLSNNDTYKGSFESSPASCYLAHAEIGSWILYCSQSLVI